MTRIITLPAFFALLFGVTLVSATDDAAVILTGNFPDPHGPWSKPVDLKVGGIDPGHITTPEGKRYLHLNGGKIVELTADGLAVKGRPRPVADT